MKKALLKYIDNILFDLKERVGFYGNKEQKKGVEFARSYLDKNLNCYEDEFFDDMSGKEIKIIKKFIDFIDKTP